MVSKLRRPSATRRGILPEEYWRYLPIHTAVVLANRTSRKLKLVSLAV